MKKATMMFAVLGALALFAMNASAAEPARATLRVRAGERAAQPIPRTLLGKFTEHLGNNIYNGIDAQILRNPTFAAFPIWSRETTPDGVTTFLYERERIDTALRWDTFAAGWPGAEQAGMTEAYHDGLAALWTRVGGNEAVKVSADTAPAGQRAQRLELSGAGVGIAQWAWLPLHRTRKYEFELLLRSPELKRFTITLGQGAEVKNSSANTSRSTSTIVEGVSGEWKTFRGTLELGAGITSNTACRFAITADGPGELVIARAMLRPADHIHGADPDVVKGLKALRPGILRWPGGNFVSGYRWRDGVGPMNERPTRPNYAWGGLEPNTFGTDEFIALCREVGAEPMICVNAGDGTPEEAAGWIEYCNGGIETPMGRLRAAGGHPEPYHVKYWEVGNELWGKWQVHWTTPRGNVDRYLRFTRVMLKADPSIRLMACGAPMLWGKKWNDTLIEGTAPALGTITDHELVGGTVSADTDPLDVYRDFMAVPGVLERRWRALWNQMTAAGVKEPRLALTELQLYAKVEGSRGRRRGETGARPHGPLNHETLVSPSTLAEGLYDVLIYHAAVRLAPFMDIITHSATVNHGGGLRKEREQVYTQPCQYAQQALADFGGATPVAVDVEAPDEKAPRVLPEIKGVARGKDLTFKTVDALAALTPGGDLLISVVHRAGAGATHLEVSLDGFQPAGVAEVRELAGDVPWAANSLAQPEAVKPAEYKVEPKENGKVLSLELKPYSVLRVRVPGRASR